MLKKTDWALGAGAAGAVVLPELAETMLPETFAVVAPVLSQSTSLCTGACGACGGSCLGALGALLWLGVCAKVKHKVQEK
jgi:hypothetical protein